MGLRAEQLQPGETALVEDVAAGAQHGRIMLLLFGWQAGHLRAASLKAITC